MTNNLFLLLFTAHIIADFYFQNNSAAEKKNTELKPLFLHSLIYLVIGIIIIIPVFSWAVLGYSLVFSISHFLIDLSKMVVCRCLRARRKDDDTENSFRNGIIYVADQILHVIIIVAISSYFYYFGNELIALSFIKNMISFVGIQSSLVLRIALVVLLLLKPINLTFKKLFAAYKPVSGDENSEGILQEEQKAGAMIGNFERLIIAALLIAGQFAAIGFIIAAKSIARYKKMSDKPEFGEYYLLGTLFSVLSTIIICLIFWDFSIKLFEQL